MNNPFINIIHYANKIVSASSRGIFYHSVEEDVVFLNNLYKKLERNDSTLQRSYFQYKCYRKLNGKFKILILDVFCIFLLLPFIVIFLLNCLRIKRNKNYNNVAVCTSFFDDTIPQSLFEEYSVLKTSHSGFCLEFSDLSCILYLLSRYPLSPFFVFKNVLKMSQYKYFIRKFNCEALIVTSEYSFTSSMMTYYCEMNSVRHINIMHGEKLFHILDSFFSFHKCYVWDEHYLKVFQKLHAAKEQFIVEQPPFFYELKQLSCNKGHGFKYFLDGTESINEILNITKQVKSKFNDLILRAHPLHTDCKRLENFKINFENPHLVAINDSIKNSEYVCAKCSTVLYKGYLMGKKVVIDDMTDPLLFNQLIDMDYIMFSKEYIKLSDLLSLSVN